MAKSRNRKYSNAKGVKGTRKYKLKKRGRNIRGGEFSSEGNFSLEKENKCSGSCKPNNRKCFINEYTKFKCCNGMWERYTGNKNMC